MASVELKEAINLVKLLYDTDVTRKEEEKEVIERFGYIFHPTRIDQLSAEDFKSFLLIRNNKHWSSIHRQGGIITSDMDKLRSTLKLLLDEDKPIKERLDQILPKNKPSMIKGLNRAVLTPILLVVYPKKYAVYNTPAHNGMEYFKLLPDFDGESFAEKYLRINEIIKRLAEENDLSLWQVDEVWWKAFPKDAALAGSSIEAGIIEETKAADNDFSAAMESYVEELIVGNWEKIREFNDLEILQEDGELIGQQYIAGDAGRIDLLCKEKKAGDFVVIELKKTGGGDRVIGQTLKYIGWIKNHLATKGERVRGIVVTSDIDSKLRYAHEPVRDLIQLMKYKVDIQISPV